MLAQHVVSSGLHAIMKGGARDVGSLGQPGGGGEGAFSAELCLLRSGDICQSQEVQP